VSFPDFYWTLDPSPVDPVSAVQSVPANGDAGAALLVVPTVHVKATHSPGLGSKRCDIKKSSEITVLDHENYIKQKLIKEAGRLSYAGSRSHMKCRL
jgi:hypothetical protein